jgi:hypothetical protein
MSRPSRFFRAVRPLGLVLILISTPTACRSRPSSSASAPLAGVGFELPGNAQIVRGALLTKPPGREEAFLAFVAGGAARWIEACRQEAGGAAPLFSFQTDAQGALGPALPDAGATARDRCLVARAIATPSPGLPPATQVTVQLALR